jgi:hypothetical protein
MRLPVPAAMGGHIVRGRIRVGGRGCLGERTGDSDHA